MATTAGGYQEVEAACRHIEVHLHCQIEREQVDDAQEDDIEQQVCDEDRGELPLCEDTDIEKRLRGREFPYDKQPRAEQAERTTGEDQRVRYPTGGNLFQHKGTEDHGAKERDSARVIEGHRCVFRFIARESPGPQRESQ